MYWNFCCNNKNVGKEITKFFVQNEEPFYLIKNLVFYKNAPQGFNPNFKSISWNNMRNIFFTIYEDYKEKLISKMSKNSFKTVLTYDI